MQDHPKRDVASQPEADRENNPLTYHRILPQSLLFCLSCKHFYAAERTLLPNLYLQQPISSGEGFWRPRSRMEIEGLTVRKVTAVQGVVVVNLRSVHGPLCQTELFEDSISVAVIRLDR